jgi:S-adenosylmethionine-diacylgycerolhomoserine-N-methlytransferase
MGLAADLKIISKMLFGRVSGDNHADRLEAFYRDQAGGYDDFRRRLLHGREDMVRALELPEGGRMLDLGGGTGSNLEAIGDRITRLSEITIVDLSPSLLRVAEDRVQRHGWTNVRTAEADVTTFDPPGGPVDVVTFSYSLTMIPDWFKAIDHAIAMLKPGGQLGVVDFYVSRKWASSGRQKHSGFRRAFWPMWFGHDNVFLSSEHLPYLQHRFEPVLVEERASKVPYLFGLKVPYYIFIGRKPLG